ncbi:hypothetical protein F0562_014877 [Nyssa sinensis]|uniref:Uncharacterized protein n=1 Tax=Nyssa sinensis TaxID=561372 RepID=A0A5J4ZU39_9ASTE|nr:hypothetical protein F0562_014877 [Nyssa sinensis]
MKNFSFLASLLILLVLLVSHCLEAEAQVCRPSGKIRGIKPPPGECNQENYSDCCVQGKLYTTYKCSPQVSTHTKAVLTLNSFQKGGDGGGPSECDNKYHSDDIPVVALSTGWYNKGGRCLNNITISANGQSVNAMVVDECDSTMGCDDDHDYQPPCANNIVDASKAVWEALGVPSDDWGDLDITWGSNKFPLEKTALHEILYIAHSCNTAEHQASQHKKIDREKEKGRMKNFSFLASLLILLVLLVAHCLEAEAQVCRPSGKIRGIKPPPGECNQENYSDCCVQGKLYTTYKCSPQVSTHTKAVLTLNSFQKDGDGGGPSECDNKYHSDDIPVVALSTGWYNKGGRCLNNITISANGRSVNAMVVDECDSTMGCDDDHDYQPPCANNIVDASKAVWEALGVPSDDWGDLDITWSDA